jgi:porin
MGELQYAVNQAPATSSSAQPSGLPGTYKLGFWYDTARFPAPQYGTGLTLPNRQYYGDYSVYAIADQTVWRRSADSPQSLGVFAVVMGAPSDRNLINFNVNAGVVLKAPFKGRDSDALGVAVAYAKVSPGVLFTNSPNSTSTATLNNPVPSAETVLEATYEYQVAPWWILQADFQYFFHPSAGIPNPATGRPVGNEAVVGLQTVVTF